MPDLVVLMQPLGTRHEDHAITRLRASVVTGGEHEFLSVRATVVRSARSATASAGAATATTVLLVLDAVNILVHLVPLGRECGFQPRDDVFLAHIGHLFHHHVQRLVKPNSLQESREKFILLMLHKLGEVCGRDARRVVAAPTLARWSTRDHLNIARHGKVLWRKSLLVVEEFRDTREHVALEHVRTLRLI